MHDHVSQRQTMMKRSIWNTLFAGAMVSMTLNITMLLIFRPVVIHCPPSMLGKKR